VKTLSIAVGGLVVAVCLGQFSLVARGCTGITLKAADGAVVAGRTMEWGSFDIGSRVTIVPRGYAFTSELPDGKAGFSWKGKYGVVGLDAVDQDTLVDGMNEKGLVLGCFYLPGFAEYEKYDPAKADESMGPIDVGGYLLSTCATVDDVRKAIEKVRVVPVVEPVLGIPAPIHFRVTEPSGRAIVIEFLKGKLHVFDAPLGVITNSPSYDWHETNMRNYINLSPVALPGREIDKIDFKPLGGGSGMIGLPGDFTPPSRFVRAVAFSSTARPTKTGSETMYELFRILDNFNVPLGAAEGTDAKATAGLRSATAWTSGYDTKNLVMCYHTQHNRRVRMIDLNEVDFDGPDKLVRQPMDKQKRQDVEDVTPRR
jgi:choloylglycine hydrolase